MFNLDEFMDRITFVSDRGSNFVSGFRDFHVLFCVAHRLNNILKRTFYQVAKKKKKNITPVKSFTISTNVTRMEVTLTKIQSKTTTSSFASPGVSIESFDDDKDENDDDSEDSSEEETDGDPFDYTESTIAELIPAAKQVIDTISQCKALVRYVKKVIMTFHMRSKCIFFGSISRQVLIGNCRWRLRIKLPSTRKNSNDRNPPRIRTSEALQ